MQAHLMHLNMKWTESLNPGQTPVDVSDQPVYALTKELQLRYPDTFSNYFPLFGQLHIEQALLVIHGQLVKGSGLLEILTENKFSMIGLSAVVDVNNIKRARYTLQIILCSLFQQLREAMSATNTDLTPYNWLTQKSKESTSCMYWKNVIDVQILILVYIRSIREGNFKLHVEVLYRLLAWVFIFDHYHYARWLTIHWFDLYTLESKFPDVYDFFCKGNFSFQKSNRDFSRMGLDQIHEQNNKIIKGAGGASDLLNKVDDSALLRWEVCSPELARVILEFEDCLDRNEFPAESNTKHHEDNEPFHKRFAADVNRLNKCISVNPFTQHNLTKLNNKAVVVPESVRPVVENLQSSGKEQLETFVSDRLVLRKTPISESITLNRLEIWNFTDKREKVDFSPSKSILKKMNSACEHRKTMAAALFQHEINNIPQSLCIDGTNGIEMYHGSKADVAKRFSTCVMLPQDRQGKSSIVIEMSPLVRAKAFATHTGRLVNFGEFSLLVYYEVMKLASNYDRIDMVFDRYFERSLKQGTRAGRGQGSQYLFEGDSTEIPFNMADSFLKHDYNKNKLYEYLGTKLLEIHQGDKILVATYQNTSLISHLTCLELDQPVSVRPCESEEADQRIVRHALNLVYNGYKNILVRTIDTDVLVLLISHISQVQLNDAEIYEIYAYLINSDKYYNIKAIIQELGSDICRAFPFFYAFTGCDTVSSFFGRGKCKAYDIWVQSSKKDYLTNTFIQLGEKPAEVTPDQIDILESYVLELYGSKHDTLGATRLDKFNKSSDNNLRTLPPSIGALRQHIYRSAYQAGYLWWQSVEELDIPDPTQWGWKSSFNGLLFEPFWTSNQSPIAVKEFIKTCSCKTGKCKTCKCATQNLPCLSMCGCGRGCI